MSIKHISFREFKRFERFAISCREANVLVGPNNAGKSTILDALRILYGGVRYARRLRPQLIRTASGDAWGYEIPPSSVPIDISNTVFNYGDEPATIEFTHKNNQKLIIELSPEHLTKLYIPDPPRHATTGPTYFSHFPIDIVIVPTLSPFEQQELYLNDITVERNRTTRLASRHFRNVWYRSTEAEFLEFSQLISQTWPEISITRPKLPVQGHLEMFYKEGRYDREIAWSGFGFQVWLQIVTHLLRGNPNSVFVLDEPDIYLHPDLQYRLLKLVKSRFNQFFLATHSAEIINRSSPGEIVSVNSKYQSAKRIRSDEDYDNVFSYIGSIDNIDISRLSRSRRVIFFEGKDKNLLVKFSSKLNLTKLSSDDTTLILPVGGFGQWQKVLSATWTFKHVLQTDVSILAIFDRDFRDEREIAQICEQISAEEVGCAIWSRKELENYALVPRAIEAVIAGRIKDKNPSADFSAPNPKALISDISNTFKHHVFGQTLANLLEYEKKIGSGKDPSHTTKDYSKIFDDKWGDISERMKMIPGKQFISTLSAYLQDNYRCSITINMILDEIDVPEIDPEMLNTLIIIDDFCGTQ